MREVPAALPLPSGAAATSAASASADATRTFIATLASGRRALRAKAGALYSAMWDPVRCLQSIEIEVSPVCSGKAATPPGDVAEHAVLQGLILLTDRPVPSHRKGCPIDWSVFALCSSVRSRTDMGHLHEAALRQAVGVSKLVRGEIVERHANAAVAAMLDNEQLLGGDYVVFYHSYSAPCIIYELQAVLAELLLNYPEDGPPVLRLLREPFREIPTLAALLEAHKSMGLKDHDARFRAVAISSVVSWFTTLGEASMTQSFLTGYFAGSDMGDLGLIIDKLLETCGIPGAKKLTGEMLKIGAEWGLDMRWYKARAGFAPAVAVGGYNCAGHVMQIFVHRSVVDSVAYACLPYGACMPNGTPFTGWVASQQQLEGQARLFVHPDLFLRSDGLVRVFAHCGDWSFGEQQRAYLRNALRKILTPALASEAARERARQGIRGA